MNLMSENNSQSCMINNSASNIVDIFDTNIHAISWSDAIQKMTDWAMNRQSRYICACNVHSVMTAQKDAQLRDSLNAADMCVPDGMPLVWLLRRHNYPEQERISGPGLTLRYLHQAEKMGLSVYFYGSTPQTLEILSFVLKGVFPALKIAGTFSPPFRPLTLQEDEEIITSINNSGASIVFIGLGCPKQEIWMAAHKDRINAVMVGVGAAFDFLAGTINRAPRIFRKAGLEWLYRLICEPRRLMKRYLTTNSKFVMHCLNYGVRGGYTR